MMNFEMILSTAQNTTTVSGRSGVLLFGIGNVGREDDGLGIRLIEKLEELSLKEGFALDSNYQLNIEDADTISRYAAVVFVDATVEEKAVAPFQLRALQSEADIAFSTHAMSMESIVALADQLYGGPPHAYVLTMPGYQWGIMDQLTPQAQKNLQATFNYLRPFLSRF